MLTGIFWETAVSANRLKAPTNIKKADTFIILNND